MSNERIDGLEENRLVTELNDLRNTIDELKSRQYTSGRSGLIGYLSQSDKQFDYITTVGTDGDPSAYGYNLTLTYTANTQRYPFAQPFLSVFVNGTEVANQVNPTTGFAGLYWTDGVRVLSIGPPRLTTTSYSDPSTYTWTMTNAYIGKVTVYYKFYTVGTDNGTVSIST